MFMLDLFVGYSLSFNCLAILARRYGGKERTLFFEDFVMCVAKVIKMFGKEIAMRNINPHRNNCYRTVMVTAVAHHLGYLTVMKQLPTITRTSVSKQE